MKTPLNDISEGEIHDLLNLVCKGIEDRRMTLLKYAQDFGWKNVRTYNGRIRTIANLKRIVVDYIVECSSGNVDPGEKIATCSPV